MLRIGSNSMIVANRLFDDLAIALPTVIKARLEKEISHVEKVIEDLQKLQLQHQNVDYVRLMSNRVSYIDGLKKAIEIIKEEVEDYVT